MTEAEVLEIINAHASNAMTALSIYVSLTFAYLMVAYLVGAKLSKLQVFVVSTLYFLSSFIFAIGAITHSQSLANLLSSYPDFIPSNLWELPYSLMLAAMTGGGIVACFYFMYDIRRRVQK